MDEIKDCCFDLENRSNLMGLIYTQHFLNLEHGRSVALWIVVAMYALELSIYKVLFLTCYRVILTSYINNFYDNENSQPIVFGNTVECPAYTKAWLGTSRANNGQEASIGHLMILSFRDAAR